jgi:aminoglycoside phosphotransferase family enzyme/predicted kinase
MQQSGILQIIKNPKFYGKNVSSVEIIQTHISYVALTGRYAYKIKKPVNFGFLDFSTLEKRKYFCEEEVRLNKRLCPEIYLDIVPITKKNNDFELNGKGKAVEYAVKMKEFPQEKIMTKQLEKEKIDEEILDKICNILNKFYKTSECSDEIDSYGSIETIKKNIDENFDQTKEVIDVTIPKEIFNYIKTATKHFLGKKKDIFEKRIKNGFIRDCHGDLHSGNIVISNKEVFIFDCIEFNKRFRYSDVASDIGFLAMDLDFQANPYHSSYFIDKYVEKSGDKGIYDVLNFYKCYRAYVRGKVIGFKLNDPQVDKKEKQEIIKTASKYFDLAYYYAALFSRDLVKSQPIFFITSGLTGTGKTTVARKISTDYNTHLISTDEIRKELQGIEKFERHHDAYNTGLYSPDKMIYTYKKALEKAEKLLGKNESVTLDATFKTKKLRDLACNIASKNNAMFIILYCSCPEEFVKIYLNQRLKKKSISDGRWEIYIKQKDSFEKFDSKDGFVEIDISNKSYDYQIKTFREILKKTNRG